MYNSSFTPLESPVYGKDGIDPVKKSFSNEVDKIPIPYRECEVKTPSFLTGFTLKEAIKDLIQEWRLYIAYNLRKIMRRRLTIMCFVLLGIATIFWFTPLEITSAQKSIAKFLTGFTINKVYGQEAVASGGVAYTPVLDKLLSLALGSSLMSIFIRFAQRKFQAFKRGFDFLMSTLGLILLSPLFLIVAILIKFDSPGVALFKQERLGKDSKIFGMWKFRTMRDNAELETGAVWAMEDDPRITKLGHFLRKAHIDELPQLINVFRGEMSLIGPRPERPEFIEEINGHIPNFNERLKVRPGITGLAQVRYKYSGSIKEAARKLKYDLLYIKKMCWMLELKILYWTVGRVLTGEGAR